METSATFSAKIETAKAQAPAVSETLFRVAATILVASAGAVGISVINPKLGYDRIQSFAWPSFLRGAQDFIASHALGSLASTYVFGALAALIVALIFFKGYPISKPKKEYLKSYFVFALPTMLISAIAVVSTNIDKVMIGYFSTATEVGYYFSAQKIAFFILVIASSVGTLLFPTVSSYHTKNMFENILCNMDFDVKCDGKVHATEFAKQILSILGKNQRFFPSESTFPSILGIFRENSVISLPIHFRLQSIFGTRKNLRAEWKFSKTCSI